MDFKRESGEGDTKRGQSYPSNLMPSNKSISAKDTISTPPDLQFILPACVIVQNVPESIFDDGFIDLSWLKTSLKTLKIPYKQVFGISPGMDALSYGIIEFKEEDEGLMKALFVERCFQEGGKGLREWTFEDPRLKKGVYMWAATDKDVMYVREYVQSIRIANVPHRCLEAARKDAYDNGANVCHIITQAMEMFERTHV